MAHFLDEGLHNGVTLILMSGTQLASVNLKESQRLIVIPGFQNTFTPLSSDGFRLMINGPGVMPNIDHQGIHIAPGFSTLIDISGKEIIRFVQKMISLTY